MKGENLPLPAAGEILYVPVDSLAVLPKLFATPPSDNMFICLASSIWCCTYMIIFYCYISTYLYILPVINECDLSCLRCSTFILLDEAMIPSLLDYIGI